MLRVYPAMALATVLASCANAGKPNVDTGLIERLYHSPVTSYECDGLRCTYMVARGELVIEVRNTADADWAAMSAGGAMLSGSHQRRLPDGDESVVQSGGELLYVRRGSTYVSVDMRAAPHNARVDAPLLAQDALGRLQVSR